MALFFGLWRADIGVNGRTKVAEVGTMKPRDPFAYIFIMSFVGLAYGLWSFGASGMKGTVFTGDGANVAINGYDPVSYFGDEKPKIGSPELLEHWKGAVWRFSSAENLNAFAKNPQHYMPQYGGYSAVGMAKGKVTSTTPEVFSVINDKLYLHHDLDAKRKWDADAKQLIGTANKRWNRIKAQGSC